MLRLAALLLSHCALASAEYAIVNMIRHGERFSDKSNIHLAPAGFQRAEYLHKHGMVDMVVHRHELKDTLATLLDYLAPAKAA